MQEINAVVDQTALALSGFRHAFETSAKETSKAMSGFIQSMEKNPVQPMSPDLHRKAVAKRKKQKRGGHK
jgi:hypothetical protein